MPPQGLPDVRALRLISRQPKILTPSEGASVPVRSGHRPLPRRIRLVRGFGFNGKTDAAGKDRTIDRTFNGLDDQLLVHSAVGDASKTI
jgi:hypothetical protein